MASRNWSSCITSQARSPGWRVLGHAFRPALLHPHPRPGGRRGGWGAAGSMSDVGIDDKFINQVGESITTGDSGALPAGEQGHGGQGARSDQGHQVRGAADQPVAGAGRASCAPLWVSPPQRLPQAPHWSRAGCSGPVVTSPRRPLARRATSPPRPRARNQPTRNPPARRPTSEPSA